MQKLLIATTNPGKAREYKEFLKDLDLEIISLGDLKNVRIVNENGKTIKDNAILKAKGYFSQFNIPTLADDAGFEIDALDGEPGVRSHRWPGYEASERELVKHALERLKGVPKKNRTARLVTWAVFYDGRNLILENENIKGYISEEFPDKIKNGFPWRSILYIPQFNKLYRDFTEKEHELINHRKKIVSKLIPQIIKLKNIKI